MPPVREKATSLYNSVRDTVKPTVETYTDKIKNDVAPTLKNVLKSSLNAVFTGVPRVIKQVNISKLCWGSFTQHLFPALSRGP